MVAVLCKSELEAYGSGKCWRYEVEDSGEEGERSKEEDWRRAVSTELRRLDFL